MSTTWTQADLEELEKAIGKGVLEVKYTDKSIRYRSLEDMFKIRDEMRKCLGLQSKGSRLFVKTSKGLC